MEPSEECLDCGIRFLNGGGSHVVEHRCDVAIEASSLCLRQPVKLGRGQHAQG